MLSTVDDVLTKLRAIDSELPSRDGAAVFNRVYLTVTERVAAALAQADVFRDDEFMAELDVVFASLWLEAYDAAAAGKRIPKAWAPLFEQRDDLALLPIQYALAGVNAHIEHDLPIAVISTCQQRDRSPLDADVRADYEAVNDLLAAAEAEIRRSFLDELGRTADDSLGPIAHLVSSWNIDKARDLAWVNVEVLWRIRDIGFLYDRVREALARSVGMGSRLLLTPRIVR